MGFWLTLRNPKDMFRQHDLHLVLVIGLVDILLTMHGVTTEQGEVMNPLYTMFTDSLNLMLLGIGLYLGVLGVASLVLAGGLRKIAASTVFGMHAFGILTWMHLLNPTVAESLVTFHYAVAAAAASALFYYIENILYKRKQKQIEAEEE